MAWSRPLRQFELVALDLEATGVAHGHDRIVEVGAARFRLGADGRVIPGPVFEVLVDPQLRIPEVVSRLTGIDDAMVRGQPTLDEIWPAFVDFLGSPEDTVVLAHCARSDLAYLVSDALRLGLEMPPHAFVCTLEVARRALPRAPKYGLEALRRYITGDRADEMTFHRAVADALHTRNLFATCVERTGARTFADLGVKQGIEVPTPEEFVVEVPDRLRALEAAIADQHRVEIQYTGGSKGRTVRPVTPLALFAHRGVAHLRAWCHLDDAAKTFRCDRISRVMPSG
ncbi:MAG: WYL domain-containing protein [Deltaproteobacteria bacterium]|nr:MAG: WYL domain-containing protein [Deltaproteobacteria bacterium]